MPLRAWQAAFTSVVIERLQRVPGASAAFARDDYDEIRRLSRRGQLTTDGDLNTALWAMFKYQPGHTEAFYDACTAFAVGRTRLPLVVLDVGCGSGAAGAAVGAVLTGRGPHVIPPRVHYVGVDHNEHARRIARSLLKRPGVLPPDSTWALRSTVTAGAAACVDRALGRVELLLATSYLFNQNLSDSFIEEFASAIVTLVDEIGPVTFLGCDIAGAPSRRRDFVAAPRAEGIRAERKADEDIRHTSTFVNLYPDRHGWVQRRHTSGVRRWKFILQR